jgi:hypothetical protein
MKHLFELILRLPRNEQSNHPEISDIVEIGKLYISTNSIVVCDPLYYYNSNVPLEVSVPNGDFITELYYTNDRNIDQQDFPDIPPCFALLRFSGEPVKYWKMAVSKGQSTENFDELDYFGFPTVSGMGCFKDEKASELYTKKYETLISENGPDFSFYEDYIDLLMEENDQFDYLKYQPSENYANNMIFFDIGNQGHYPSYFGFDVNHNPVCLVTDFLVFDDVHYYRYLSQNIKNEIEKLTSKNKLNNEVFSEIAASQLKHLFNNTRNFINEYKHTDLELLTDDLFNLLSKYIKTGAGAFITLSATIELVKSHTKSPEYLVDLAIDMILVSLGEKIEFIENEKESEEKEKIIALTHEIMELESHGFYEEAIEKINQQLIKVEELNKKSFLIYDKMAVLNNKAYYLLLLKLYGEALDVINNAILEFDDAAELYHTRAEIYHAIKNYNNALVDINKSIELAYEDSKEELKSEILKKI